MTLQNPQTSEDRSSSEGEDFSEPRTPDEIGSGLLAAVDEELGLVDERGKEETSFFGAISHPLFSLSPTPASIHSDPPSTRITPLFTSASSSSAQALTLVNPASSLFFDATSSPLLSPLQLCEPLPDWPFSSLHNSVLPVPRLLSALPTSPNDEDFFDASVCMSADQDAPPPFIDDSDANILHGIYTNDPQILAALQPLEPSSTLSPEWIRGFIDGFFSAE
jgi:hypothetical protein